MDIQLNPGAQKAFDSRSIEGITTDDSYPVWTRKDPFGRAYFGVENFCGIDTAIKEDTDLSWMEWEGNEVFLSDEDSQVLFERAVGIIKGWRDQLVKGFPKERFVVFASFDDGSDMAEECEKTPSFTLRFWKKRDGQGPDENTDYDQPMIKWNN